MGTGDAPGNDRDMGLRVRGGGLGMRKRDTRGLGVRDRIIGDIVLGCWVLVIGGWEYRQRRFGGQG